MIRFTIWVRYAVFSSGLLLLFTSAGYEHVTVVFDQQAPGDAA